MSDLHTASIVTFSAWDTVMHELQAARDREPMRSTRRMAIERAIVAIRSAWPLVSDSNAEPTSFVR